MDFPSDSLIEMVPSDSGDDTTSRNDRIAGMNQAPDSDSSDKFQRIENKYTGELILAYQVFHATWYGEHNIFGELVLCAEISTNHNTYWGAKKRLPEIIRSQTQTFQFTQTSHC